MTGGALSRRRFLTGAGAAGATLAGGLAAGHWLGEALSGSAPSAVRGGGPLVVVTLYGGNDGLNTVVPYSDPAYLAARPTIGYQAHEVLDIGDGMGLNPQLTQLHGLWQQGRLAVVRGVGYPNPNLSHFASMGIWQTANPSDGTGPGWLGRWLDTTDHDPMRAISVGTTLPVLLRGARATATAVTSPRIQLPGGAQLEAAFAAMQQAGNDRSGLAGQVAAAGSDLLSAKAQLAQLRIPSSASQVGAATGSGLAAQLAVVADLINAGAPTEVYQVSSSSFDTHAGEKADQERLLKDLDTGIAQFLQAVAGQPRGRQAVVMTYSEFGRRPTENASGGTDHGAASVLFVAGHQVKGGTFYGDQPSLTKLDPDGNLVFNVDFRAVYSTVLERVLGVDPSAVVGGRFPTLGFV